MAVKDKKQVWKTWKEVHSREHYQMTIRAVIWLTVRQNERDLHLSCNVKITVMKHSGL